MVHALRQIHRWLRPRGVLLDLHPEPEHAGLEVWQDGTVRQIGRTANEEDLADIHDARGRLRQLEDEGWYSTQEQRVFDLVSHFPSPDDWLEFQDQEGYTTVVDGDLLNAARDLINSGGGEFIVREPIRASLLTSLHKGTANARPGNL
ncbi:MAG: hypothetical protein R3258_00425 [Acidimicrobiia bacterium]|nr:hypothetical protein [Acidimicrobiia bacterium]